MVDTVRSKATLLASLFQDGQAAASISEQDMRDFIVSVAPPFMGLSITTPVQTSISSSGVYVKAAGTTTVTNKSADMDDNSVSNRIRYTGVSPRHFHLVSQASISLASGTNQDIGLQIWHWDDSAGSGTLLAHSEARTTFGATDVIQITTHGDMMMDTNDYIEMHVANNTGTVNFTLDFGYLFAVGMLM